MGDTPKSSLFRRLATAVAVACASTYLAFFLGIHIELTYNDTDCKLIEGIGPGSEDIVVVDNNLALVSAGDIDRFFFKSNRPPRIGNVFAITFDDGTEKKRKVETLELEGFPHEKRSRFNPHGISFSNRTMRVYAVSHNCGEEEGDGSETIEVFKLDRDQGSIKLVHEFTMTSPSFPLGGMNDVTEGAYLGEVYVTQWVGHSMSEKCIGNGGFGDFINEKINPVNALFRRTTKVQRCVWDSSSSSTVAEKKLPTNCTVVAKGFKQANGITSNPQKTIFYVADATGKQIRIFDRKHSDGSLSLRDTIDLPYYTDNIEYDVSSGKLTMAATPILHQAYRRVKGDSSVNVSGGMLTIAPLTNGSYVLEEVLMHDGSELSMASSAVFMNGKVLIGSPGSDGVLVCPVPLRPISSEVR